MFSVKFAVKFSTFLLETSCQNNRARKLGRHDEQDSKIGRLGVSRSSAAACHREATRLCQHLARLFVKRAPSTTSSPFESPHPGARQDLLGRDQYEMHQNDQ
jgi:hypothetical protein